MNGKVSIFIFVVFLMIGFIANSYAQSVIGTFSDTLYLLSIFHSSGDKGNISENYYCAVFLDKESNIENILPLKTMEDVYFRYDTSDLIFKKNWYVRTNAEQEQRIAEEIYNYFVANPSIGAGMALIKSYSQYMNGRDTSDLYYHFFVDVFLNSEIRNNYWQPDMLSGEITDPLVTGGLKIGLCDTPSGPWIFDYEKKGTYYKLFKLCVDYLLLDDPNGCVLAKSYECAIYPRSRQFNNVQDVLILLGDVGSPFLSHLKIILKEGKYLTALPYSVVKLSEE